MTLNRLNQLSKELAEIEFMQCCTSNIWVTRMVKALPFETEIELKKSADKAWMNLDEEDYLQAFEGHPKIGDVNSLREKYSSTKALASGEQSSVSQATEQVLLDLANGNQQYLQRFGFIFIICATGKSAEEMLLLLQQRLPNDRATELVNAAEEQRKIFQIRINKLLEAN